jgi:hypothetical protein
VWAWCVIVLQGDGGRGVGGMNDNVIESGAEASAAGAEQASQSTQDNADEEVGSKAGRCLQELNTGCVWTGARGPAGGISGDAGQRSIH